jgi:hypothetical protein
MHDTKPYPISSLATAHTGKRLGRHKPGCNIAGKARSGAESVNVDVSLPSDGLVDVGRHLV